jgi:hypothetical protein
VAEAPEAPACSWCHPPSPSETAAVGLLTTCPRCKREGVILDPKLHKSVRRVRALRVLFWVVFLAVASVLGVGGLIYDFQTDEPRNKSFSLWEFYGGLSRKLLKPPPPTAPRPW